MFDEGRIFYLRRTADDEVGEEDEGLFAEKDKKSHLCAYNVDDRKETVLGDANDYQITFDGKKMLVKIKKDYAIIDVPKEKLETKDHEHKIDGLDMQLDRRAEWRQIYFECWRQMRDFFVAPTMNAVDWKAMRDKYAALVPFVNHRNDLTYLLGELIGELNSGHTYVGGGERPGTPRIKLGLLGAEFSRDSATRTYRIERILPGENWIPPHPLHGPARVGRVYEALLSASPQARTHCRCPRQRRRLRLAARDRAVAARAGDGRDCAQRHAANGSVANVHRPDGHIDQRILRIRWRYFSVSLQNARAWEAHRQTHLGWRDRDSRVASTDGWGAVL